MLPEYLLKVGDEAPNFCLQAAYPGGAGPEKRSFCLRDFRGKKPVVIEFFGAAFTPT